MATRTTERAASQSGNRTARLEARITAEQKDLFQRAAALQGRSLTDFLVSSAQEQAMRIIREHEVMDLSIRDREAFVAALLEASEPSPRLRKAAENYMRNTLP